VLAVWGTPVGSTPGAGLTVPKEGSCSTYRPSSESPASPVPSGSKGWPGPPGCRGNKAVQAPRCTEAADRGAAEQGWVSDGSPEREALEKYTKSKVNQFL
ncbi:hypothetical protein MC885_004593, partial [Smutsia gigantea]